MPENLAKRLLFSGMREVIFEDPITKVKREGLARLIEYVSSNYEGEYWVVRFLEDDFITTRFIAY